MITSMSNIAVIPLLCDSLIICWLHVSSSYAAKIKIIALLYNELRITSMSNTAVIPLLCDSLIVCWLHVSLSYATKIKNYHALAIDVSGHCTCTQAIYFLQNRWFLVL